MATTVEAQPRQARGSAWVLGPVVGVLAIAGVTGSGAGFSVTDDLPVPEMLDKLADAGSAMLLMGAAQALAAMGLVIFGAALHQRLARVEPEGSILSRVAWGGSLLTAACMAVAAMHTQIVSDGAKEAVDPAIPLTLHTLEESLYAGAWCSLALVAGALAVAGFKHRLVPSWLAGVSAFIAVLLVVLQVVVPWGGWFPGAIWLIATGVGLRRIGPGASH